MVKTKSNLSVTEMRCNRALLFALVNRLLFWGGGEGEKGGGLKTKK